MAPSNAAQNACRLRAVCAAPHLWTQRRISGVLGNSVVTQAAALRWERGYTMEAHIFRWRGLDGPAVAKPKCAAVRRPAIFGRRLAVATVRHKVIHLLAFVEPS
jgi:hypothetical protein